MSVLLLIVIFVGILFLIKNKKGTTVGLRNNNPFNIRSNYIYSSQYLCWPGEKGFRKFYFLDDGLEAGYRLLFYYFKNREKYPVKDFIGRYAEGNEGYITFLENALRSKQILKQDIQKLGKLIVRFENGSDQEDSRMNQAFERAKNRVNV